MVFVDTSAWFARYVPTDPHHESVKAWLDANTEPLLTTDYCVDETLTLLAARRHLRRAIEAGRALFQADVARLHFLTPDQIRRAWIFFEQRADPAWSFTDCTSKVVIDELEVKTAVTLDSHFHQFGVVVVP
jgi:uncharacterized protein